MRRCPARMGELRCELEKGHDDRHRIFLEAEPYFTWAKQVSRAATGNGLSRIPENGNDAPGRPPRLGKWHLNRTVEG